MKITSAQQDSLKAFERDKILHGINLSYADKERIKLCIDEELINEVLAILVYKAGIIPKIAKEIVYELI